MAKKSSEKPSNVRYKAENRRLKNKIRDLKKYLKGHPKDRVAESRLQELMK